MGERNNRSQSVCRAILALIYGLLLSAGIMCVSIYFFISGSFIWAMVLLMLSVIVGVLSLYIAGQSPKDFCWICGAYLGECCSNACANLNVCSACYKKHYLKK